MKRATQCWCGSMNLRDYSPLYVHCLNCNTLVLKDWPVADPTHVEDSGELYSKDYYLQHLPKSYGYPSIYERTRLDFTDRIPYWLHTLLKYRLPPSSVLELGSAHGGFVAILKWAGYKAAGLELSPWLVNFAKKNFGVHMFQGVLESQNIPKNSLDIIVHMDVLEHLPDPVATMRLALSLLKLDGIMLIQTPLYDPSITYEELLKTNHPFLVHYNKNLEHLHLFSANALEKLFHDLGCDYLKFEPAIFSQYDMFALVSRRPLRSISLEQQVSALQAHPSGRLVQALLDLYDRANELQHHADERLKIIQEQSAEIDMLRATAQERLDLIDKLSDAKKQ